jgi:hypothetical protein
MNRKRWHECDLDHASKNEAVNTKIQLENMKETTFGDLGIGRRVVQKMGCEID